MTSVDPARVYDLAPGRRMRNSSCRLTSKKKSVTINGSHAPLQTASYCPKPRDDPLNGSGGSSVCVVTLCRTHLVCLVKFYIILGSCDKPPSLAAYVRTTDATARQLVSLSQFKMEHTLFGAGLWRKL